MVPVNVKLPLHFRKGEGYIESGRVLFSESKSILRTIHSIPWCPGELYFECKFKKIQTNGPIYFGLTTKDSKSAPGRDECSIGCELNETKKGFIYCNGKRIDYNKYKTHHQKDRFYETTSNEAVQEGDDVGCRIRFEMHDEEMIASCTFTKNNAVLTRKIFINNTGHPKFYPTVASGFNGLEIDANISYRSDAKFGTGW